MIAAHHPGYLRQGANFDSSICLSSSWSINLANIPRQFTITTNNSSARFNINVLSSISDVIEEFIRTNPDQNEYHIDIDDNSNAIDQMEQLYQGNLVDFGNFPNIQEIADILEMDYLKKAIHKGEIAFSSDFLRHYFKNIMKWKESIPL